MPEKDWMLLVALIVTVVLTQWMRCHKQQFYTPIAQNPRMEGHVLNRKYHLHTKPGVNYRKINRWYLAASLGSFLTAAGVAVWMGYLAGAAPFLAFYPLGYVLVTQIVARTNGQVH